MKRNYLRNIFFVIVTLVLTMFCVGCKRNVVSIDDIDIEAVDAPTSSSTSSNPHDDVISTTTEINEEPFILFKVSDRWASKFGGAYLLTNNTHYSLNDASDIVTFTGYNQGWNLSDRNVTGMYIYSDTKSEHITMLGDFVIPVVTKMDQMISYNNTELTLVEVCDIGYGAPIAVGVEDHEGAYGFIEDMSSQNYTLVDTNQGNIKEFHIKDSNGNEIEDIFDMEKDSKCTISWFSGTDFHEVDLKAFCRTFEIKKDAEGIVLEGTLNENGYATYNTREIPNGTYLIKETCGLVTIQND